MKGLLPHLPDLEPWRILAERAVEALESIAKDLTLHNRAEGRYGRID